MNLKIEKFIDEIDKKNFIKEAESIDNDDSLNKDQLIVHELIMRNLDNEQIEEYNKLGTKEKEEILAVVKLGRKEKSKEEILKENIELFEKFKKEVLNKEKIYKSQKKTEFKNQIIGYSDYTGHKERKDSSYSNKESKKSNKGIVYIPLEEVAKKFEDILIVKDNKENNLECKKFFFNFFQIVEKIQGKSPMLVII